MSRKFKYIHILTKDFLEKEYIDNKKSLKRIAKEIGCSHGTIFNYLKKYKIKLRNILESQQYKKQYESKVIRLSEKIGKEYLFNKYFKELKSLDEIREELHISKRMIRKLFYIYNIPIRIHKERIKISHNKKDFLIQASNRTSGNKNPMFGKLGKEAPNWKGGSIIITCFYCGENIQKEKCNIKEHNFCDQKCFHKWESIAFVEEGNPNYINGKSREPYPLLFNIQLKDKIRVRDNFVCQLCGVPELECNKRLAVHHIDYNKINCKENNLISLCIKCNSKVNKNRNHWKNIFEGKLLWKLSEIS
jgi:predicted DNA-binding protein YlxM (UPF0122 family)